ncbi:MAG: ribose 5-phosphate isomerase B [Bacteroidetes bacterium]|uniref:Ribose 5-phosphate isomerase B n=1 Tax=Phaeocystidibacter marisrubri TaxID=1577780 RepID=A0A6L3ZFI8_9FLAO|nr:ribose 5-phosphate isomerase B [Phaeocystidibacter marisrubri]KAB2816500.1 ribose 5-phosphate isomerase B [Phaeocystidibacter marisrubri]TNE29855.1 MAG: ribose 5-phosphate isomerase B [Bacteroidota bacterium]GGH69366.1 ribose 5-phosphate isomerase B [Phaeocystidibacter marisrubri]
MNISIGADHAGIEYKAAITKELESKGHTVTDHGAYSEESVDYPDFGHPVANDVENGKADLGIVICGSGNGINMTVNKHAGIRSALCWNTELAALARQHNNANVLALPARFIDLDLALACVNTFITEEFEGGRHERRVNKIPC